MQETTSEIHQKWQLFGILDPCSGNTWFRLCLLQWAVQWLVFFQLIADLFKHIQKLEVLRWEGERRSHGSKNHRCLGDLFATRRFSSYISVSETNGGLQWGGPIFFGVRRWKVKMFSLKAHHGTQNPIFFYNLLCEIWVYIYIDMP